MSLLLVAVGLSGGDTELTIIIFTFYAVIIFATFFVIIMNVNSDNIWTTGQYIAIIVQLVLSGALGIIVLLGPDVLDVFSRTVEFALECGVVGIFTLIITFLAGLSYYGVNYIYFYGADGPEKTRTSVGPLSKLPEIAAKGIGLGGSAKKFNGSANLFNRKRGTGVFG